MPKMHIDQSITINAPADAIYAKLNDFNHWRPWSPWLIQEPEAKVKIGEDAKSQRWDGDRVGSGEMKIKNEIENESIDYDLNFLKPWKSHADVRFELKSSNGQTEVRWLMDSSLPWFMFWMKKLMIALVGMDYERGLLMLKDYVEDGQVHSSLEFTGSSHYRGCSYIGISGAGSKAQMGPGMTEAFTKLGDFINGKDDQVAGPPFSIYHKFDMVKDHISFTCGIPVLKIPDNLPAEFVTGKIPATPMYSVKHTGPYHHLGNAWSTMHGMMRAKVFKYNKKIHGFEIYHNDPHKVDEKDLLTEVCFATK